MGTPSKNIGTLLEKSVEELKKSVPNLADGAGVAAFVKTFWPDISPNLALIIGGAVAVYSTAEDKKKLNAGNDNASK